MLARPTMRELCTIAVRHVPCTLIHPAHVLTLTCIIHTPHSSTHSYLARVSWAMRMKSCGSCRPATPNSPGALPPPPPLALLLLLLLLLLPLLLILLLLLQLPLLQVAAKAMPPAHRTPLPIPAPHPPPNDDVTTNATVACVAQKPPLALPALRPPAPSTLRWDCDTPHSCLHTLPEAGPKDPNPPDGSDAVVSSCPLLSCQADASGRQLSSCTAAANG